MAEVEDWTAADDARILAAMATLRADVESLPLADVRFVKARGSRRRRQRMLTWTAAVAAAVVAVGVVGYGQLGRDTTQPLPPARTTSSATTTTPTSSLDTPGLLPLVGEWETSLGTTGLTLTPLKETDPVDCMPTYPAKAVPADGLDGAATFSGSQYHFATSSAKTASAGATRLVDDLLACPSAPLDVKAVSGAGWPKVLRYSGPGGAAGWYAVALSGRNVSYLTISALPDQQLTLTQAQVAVLASTAQSRLERYGPSGSTGAAPTTTSSRTPAAVDEQMPVSGIDPAPSSDLFVAASQWAAPLFARGATASAAPADRAPTVGDIGVPCETAGYLSSIGGRLGIVTVRAGQGSANVIGRQRVRVDDSASTQQQKAWASAQVAATGSLLAKGCSEPDGKVLSTAGPSEGAYLLTKNVSSGDGSGVLRTWVGVTTQQTPGAVSTIVFTGTGDGQGFQGSAAEGFAELDRLLALARQK